MTWIELHTTLRDHPKAYSLATALRIPEAQAIGHLVLLWLWAIEQAEEGRLRVPHAALARACTWEGKPERLIDALVEAGWVDRLYDGTLAIHDWEEYAGRLIHRRAANVARQRAYRASHNAHVDGNDDANAARNGDANGARDVTRKLQTHRTGPNRTQPNRTKPNLTSVVAEPVSVSARATKPRLRDRAPRAHTPDTATQKTIQDDLAREFADRLGGEERVRTRIAKALNDRQSQGWIDFATGLRNWLEQDVAYAREHDEERAPAGRSGTAAAVGHDAGGDDYAWLEADARERVERLAAEMQSLQ
jgi:hypothetical protein